MAADDTRPKSVRSLSRAAQLLLRLVATGWFDLESIARELVVPVSTLEHYLNGREPMPLDRQLCLALFLIEHVPPLARQGRQLRGQVQAAAAFHARETEPHAVAPPRTVFP